jgi:hypothetical protein
MIEVRRPHVFLGPLAIVFLLVSIPNAEIPAGYAGTPYPTGHGPWEIPGRIDFLNYDQGGLNVSFYADDQAGMSYSSAATRTDAGGHPAFYKTYQGPTDFDSVTINGVRYRFPSTDTTKNDWYIGASHPSNWTKWTVHVAKPGKYWISSVWGADAHPIQFQVIFMNGTKTATVTTPNLDGTGSYHDWAIYNDVASVQLDSGVQVLQFQNKTYHLNQDFIYFLADSAAFNYPTAARLPEIKPARSGAFDLSISRKTVRFTLPDAGLTKISVFNSLGREIGCVLNKSLGAGDHTTLLPMANLKQGVYFLYIRHNAENTVVRFEAIAK